MFTILAFMALHVFAGAQATALLVKKKNGRTLLRYYPGQTMAFTTVDGMPVSGQLKLLTQDSLMLMYYQTMQAPNMYGGIVTDTTGRFPLAFSIKNIGSFPRQKKARFLSSLLMVGGTAFVGVNLFNTIREGDPPFGKDNLPLLLAGVATAVTGYLIKALQPSSYVVGTKYKVQVVQ